MGMIINPSRFGGGGGSFSPVAYRYWRVLITANNGSSSEVAIGRMELFYRDSNGYLCNDASDTSKGSASSKNSNSGYEATRAFNNADPICQSDPDCWASNAAPSVGSPQWLKYDFGAGNSKAICAFAIHARSNNTFAPGQCPKDFVLQGSDDDSTWNDVITVTNSTGWSQNEMRRFLHPSYPTYSGSLFGARRYWRWVEWSLNGAGAIAEIEMRATIGGSDYTPAGTITASSTYGSNTASKAFDNNGGTFYSPTIGVQPASIRMDYGSGNEKVCAEMLNQARNDGFVSFSPRVILMQCSHYSDNGPWATVISTGNTITSWTAGQSRTHSDSQFV